MASRKDRPRGAPTDGAAAAAAPAADEAGGVWRYVRPTTLAKLVVWAILQVIFYRLEFGLVFFIASCFYWVWDSMSSSAATDGERVSAYSVFNRGVSALPGTLNANEFDNMMRGGFAPPPGGEEEKRPAVGGVDDNDEEDQAIQRAAMASLKHRKATTEQQKTKAKKPPTTKAHTYASSSSSSSVAAPKPLVFDSDLQALMRSVVKP